MGMLALASALLLAPGPAAYAADSGLRVGVPPDALGVCEAAGPDQTPGVGGWTGGRDAVSAGTSSTDDAPVRPRSARLFEPCFKPTGELPASERPLTIPVMLTDTPVDMLDENDDGIDDGAPGGDGDGSLNGTTSCSTTDPGNCATLLEAVQYGPISGSGDWWVWCFDRSGSTSTRALGWHHTGLDDAAGGLMTNGTEASFGPFFHDCGGSADGYRWFDYSVFGDITDWIFAPSELASELYELCHDFPEDPMCSDDEGAYPPPSSTGTSYYGGTQGAQYVFGAGENYISGAHFQVTCSPDYAGSSPVTTDFPMKESTTDMTTGETSTNVDTSETPPVGTGDPPQWWANKYWTPDADFTASDCRFLLSIDFFICSFAANDPAQFGCAQFRWESERYSNGAPYQGPDADDPTVLICTIYPERPGCYAILHPDSLDVPIVCIIEAEGDFFTWVVAWIGNLPGWIGCMVTPEGWDRSGLISRTIDNGPVGQTRDAFVNAMPNGIACGEVATIPIPDATIVINSCDADFAPGWVKSTMGWLLVFGLCVLIVRRIMRSVGGDA